MMSEYTFHSFDREAACCLNKGFTVLIEGQHNV